MLAASSKRRPMGATNSTEIKDLREAQAASGMLPHEFLLHVMRGEGVEQKYWDIKRDAKGNEIHRELKTTTVYADFSLRVDCAKAAAPYYAAKLATQVIAVTDATSGAFAGLDVKGLTDPELRQIKKILADALLRRRQDAREAKKEESDG